jgi:hypothetical protein
MITLDAITLPEDLIWVDEFAWTPVQQTESFTLTGALILETGLKQAGRPITLVGGDSAAWIDRATLKALHTKLADAATMTLTLNDGRTFAVVFKGDQPVTAEPIVDYSTPDDGDWYSLTLKLMQV